MHYREMENDNIEQVLEGPLSSPRLFDWAIPCGLRQGMAEVFESSRLLCGNQGDGMP